MGNAQIPSSVNGTMNQENETKCPPPQVPDPVHGVGKDLQKAGDEIQEEADEHKGDD